MKTLRVLATGVGYGSGFWKDADGYWSTFMGVSDVRDITIDWTGWLEGDTISTSAFASSGITENSESNTTTSATVTVTAPSDPYGATVNAITTAAGRTKLLTIRVYRESV